MITCILNGRLGNQMFQIAATIATAQRYSVPYSIPRKTLNDWFPVYFDHLPCAPHSGRMLTWEEKANCYEEIKYSGRTLRLNGYFQSYKYFEQYRSEISSAFFPSVSNTLDCVSIHVRRGDYLTNPDFPVLGMQYYRKAIQYFKELGFNQFYVFSDDMKWCLKEFTSENFAGCEFTYSLVGTEKSDMRLMSRCRHHIIANSSFSWWGAWLNINPRKIVIAPDTWFKNKNADMLPPEWLIFKNQ